MQKDKGEERRLLNDPKDGAEGERQLRLARYVGGKLSEEEAAELERAMLMDPALAEDAELTARLRSGMQTLAQQGELSRYAQQPATAWRPLALAASIAAVAVGVVALYLSVQIGRLKDQIAVVNAPQVLESVSPLTVMRGANVTELRGAPGVWHGLSIEAEQFRGRTVSVTLLDDAGRSIWERQLRVSNDSVRVASIELAINTGTLTPGRYRLQVRSSDPGPAATVSFALEVVPSRDAD